LFVKNNPQWFICLLKGDVAVVVIVLERTLTAIHGQSACYCSKAGSGRKSISIKNFPMSSWLISHVESIFLKKDVPSLNHRKKMKAEPCRLIPGNLTANL